MQSRHLREWALVTLVVLALIWMFGRQVRAVQIQAERAAVQSTLGALRTALVLDQLTRQVRGTNSGAARPAAVPNPFMLLKAVPVNFAGNQSMLRADAMALGAWVFDGECACVGYRLVYPEGLEVPEGAAAVWFRIDAQGGVLQILPLTRYVWQGQVLG